MAFFVSVDKSAHAGETLTGWVLAQKSRSRFPVSVVMAGESTCDGTFCMHHNSSKYFTAILITRGMAVWSIRGSEHILSQGDIALEQIGAQVGLRSFDRDGFQQMFVRFEGPSVRGITAQLGLSDLDYMKIPRGHLVSDTIKDMVLLGNAQIEYSDEHLSAAAYSLLVLLAGIGERGHLPESLLLALQCIEQNQDQHLTVNRICKEIGVSRSSLLRLFRDHFNRSPLQYVLEQKIELSKSLIVSRRFSLKEIAYKLGYTSQTYFSRQFAQITGMSPRKFAEEKQVR